MEARTWKALLFLALSCAATLAGYEVVRSVSSSLFVKAYGSAKIPYVLAVVPFSIAGATLAYSLLLRRSRPFRTFLISIFAASLLIAVFQAICQSNLRIGAFLLYLFKETYIVLLISQYWSFVNSSIRTEDAKRFNGPYIGVTSIGSILGGLATGRLAQRIGSEHVLYVAVGFTVLAGVLAWLGFRGATEPKPKVEHAPGWRSHFALEDFRRTPTLPALAAIVALSQVVSILFELTFMQAVEKAFPETDLRTAFLGDFSSAMSGAGLMFMFVVSPLLLKRYPLRVTHLMIPAVHAVGALVSLLIPGLASAASAFFLFKALDYSLFGAAKELIYIPLSFDARYRAKPLIDAFTYRTSKGLTSITLSILTGLRGAIPAIPGFPIVGGLCTLLWAAFAHRLVTVYDKSSTHLQNTPVRIKETPP